MNKGGVKKRFRDMKLTGKMVVIYLLAGLVPVMIILGITYMEMKKILWARETTILESYVSQTTDSMDNELFQYGGTGLWQVQTLTRQVFQRQRVL